MFPQNFQYLTGSCTTEFYTRTGQWASCAVHSKICWYLQRVWRHTAGTEVYLVGFPLG